MEKMNLARKVACLWAICLTACTTAEDNAPATTDCDAGSEQLIGFEQLFSMYRGEVAELTLDQVLEGFVISSDAEGNVFGSIYLQDQLANPSFGLELKTDLLETDAPFPPGSRVRRARGPRARARGSACVLFPLASIPSNVMNNPCCIFP